MIEVLIEKLGAQGDGIAKHNGRPVYVPTALPGEIVAADGEAPNLNLVKVLQPSKDRQKPPCPHFGSCGGCRFQHAKLEFLLDWKRHEVELAFSKAGLKIAAEETIATSAAARRRVTFSAQRDGDKLNLGFKGHKSDELVDINSCSILLPSLESEIEPLRTIAKTLLRGREEIQISVNSCDNGFDLDFRLEQFPSEDMTAAFVRGVAKSPYLRASINGEIVIEKEKPLVAFGKAKVAIPPGGFLQAVSKAEAAMVTLVCDHLGTSKRIVDLFCGSGTFSLPLAEKSWVHAVETDSLALEALRSAGGCDGLKTITTEQRDLFELPLMASELKRFDGLCLDPPRAGAREQILQIAKTDIRRVAYVSCNPASLAEDAMLMVAAGFTLERVVPIDQFVYSPHIEVVALFSKKANKNKRSIFR